MDMEIKLENTKLGWQATMEKIKISVAINSINVDEFNYLEEKVCNMRRMKTEKMDEDWGCGNRIKGRCFK